MANFNSGIEVAFFLLRLFYFLLFSFYINGIVIGFTLKLGVWRCISEIQNNVNKFSNVYLKAFLRHIAYIF
jgi:hypothetical protein